MSTNDPATAVLTALHYLWYVPLVVAAFFVLRLLMSGVVYIANTEYGIVERKWAFGGKSTDLVALNKSAGFVPEVLRGGWHFLVPFQYRIHKRPLIRVDKIAYLVARVGAPLGEGQALAAWPRLPDPNTLDSVSPENTRAFLTCGGQRGLQRMILRTGTYAINTALFGVISEEAIYDVMASTSRTTSGEDAEIQQQLASRRGYDPVVIDQDAIGIVTVQDGPSLTHGEIIAPTVGTDPTDPAFHNSFQDIAAFLAAGGRRGRQEQVLVEGTYYINRLFATVELKEKTKVGIGTVGVVNSFVGAEAVEALSGDMGRGRTVDKKSRGIWNTPLEPGKYALNTYAMEITHVPTTNFSLRWEQGIVSRLKDARSEANRVSYDDDLREILLITKDGFECLLPLAMVAHISPMSAPHVIQRFSQVTRFVTQMLDPMVSSFFRDAAQERTLIDFVSQRTAIGEEALLHVKRRLAEHRIDVEEVIVGTPRDLDGRTVVQDLFNQLRSRQTAEQERLTYAEQGKAADAKKELNELLAAAEQQTALTASKIAVEVATNEGNATSARKSREVEGIKQTADAQAYARLAEGEAEAKANALIADSLGGPQNLILRGLAEQARLAITGSQRPLVPTTLVSLGGGEWVEQLKGLLGGLSTKSSTQTKAK